MSARIVVTAGDQAGTELWISQPVVLIGGDSSSDLALLSCGLAGPAIVEFRNDRYWLFNQSGQTVALDGRPIAPDAEVEWPRGAELSLRGETRLRLVVEGSAAPSERPFNRPAVVAPQPAAGPSAAMPANASASSGADRQSVPAKKSSTVMFAQIGVIIACALGIAAIIVFGGDEVPADADSGARLQALVETGFAIQDPLAGRLVRRLQSAEAAYRRRDRMASLRRFQELQQYLAARRPTEAASETKSSPMQKFEGDLERFVRRRLSDLSAPPESS